MYRLFMVAAVLLGTDYTLGVRELNAQFVHDCGNECRVCGTNKWEGRSHSPNGPYSMDCVNTGEDGGCSAWDCRPELANTKRVPAEAIAEVVASASAAEMQAVLTAYGDRLLYAPERRAAIVVGTSCSPDGIAMLVMLEPAKARAFERARALNPSRVGLLRDFLARQVATST
jgi:hypothetical protein